MSKKPVVKSGTASLGELEQMVILAILRMGNEAYGAPIVEEILERTGRNVSRTAVYVTLTRLEKRRLVTSRLGDPTPERGGKAKRFFRVEAAAVEAVKRSRDDLVRMWDGLSALG